MGRPSGNADQLLLAAAMEIARVSGCSGLRVREVADRAGVNLGMFHYHFKNKKRFTRVLLQDLYERFFERLTAAAGDGPDALTQLRNSLIVFGKFIRDERLLVNALVKDVLNGDPEVLRFIRKNVPRHGSVIASLLLRCQAEKSMLEIPLPQAMSFVMSGLNAPSLIFGATERAGISLPIDFGQAISDEAIVQRVDLILRALKL